MILAIALLLIAAPSPVRAELVEARLDSDSPATRPSTSSGRTVVEGQTPIDAERAFAADAQTLGQWTAFAKWSTDDAMLFVPQPTNAHAWLKDRKNPPKAIDWWPTASYISCDGKLAVNTGGWQRPDGSVGYFSTVWQRQKDGGWKWVVDGGDSLKVARPRPVRIKVIRGTCDGSLRLSAPQLPYAGHGEAPDGSLLWSWLVKSDGSRAFVAAVRIGSKHKLVIDNRIPAPSK